MRGRAFTADQAWCRWRTHAATRGVTRVADVTGFDRIGVPVFQAVRPLARSLSVSQGKSAVRAAARTGALMEALELAAAEELPPGDWHDTAPPGADVWQALVPTPAQPQRFDLARPRAWLMGRDLLSGRPLPVPRALVSMDFSVPLPPDLEPCSTGLAAGSTAAEALVPALLELIERDAVANWLELSPAARAATAFDPAGFADRSLDWVLARIARAGCAIAVWNLSAVHAVPVVMALIIDGPGAAQVAPVYGSGADLTLAGATLRAVLEAVQGRVTLIAGARDDITDAPYRDPAGQTLTAALENRHIRPPPPPAGPEPPRPPAVMDWLLGRLSAAGVPAVAALDLGPADGPAIVKVAAPGLRDED